MGGWRITPTRCGGPLSGAFDLEHGERPLAGDRQLGALDVTACAEADKAPGTFEGYRELAAHLRDAHGLEARGTRAHLDAAHIEARRPERAHATEAEHQVDAPEVATARAIAGETPWREG